MKQLIQALALLGLLGIAGLLLLFLAPSWPTLFGVLVLDPRAFITIKSLRFGLEEAIIVVFIASVSEAIGQSFVLFVNRIPPSRFIFSLLITSILYAFNFGIWAAGLWLVTILLFRGDTRLFEVASTLGFSYAPFIFGLAIALPYAGRAIYILLILWSVAALAVGLTVLLNIALLHAFIASLLGFLVLLVFQRTIGYPFIFAVHWLTEKLLGVELVIDKKHLQKIVDSGINPEELEKDTGDETEEEKTKKEALWHNYLTEMSLFISPISKNFLRIGHHLEVVKIQNLKTVLEYVGLGFLGLCLILLFSPAKTWLQEGFFALDDAVRLTFDLIGFSLLLLFLGLFLEALTSPLEALGWWAGWYSPSRVYAEEPWQQLAPPQNQVQRYIVYLDGICQESTRLKPYAQNFLAELYGVLPAQVRIVGNIMPYSTTNRALTDSERPLAGFWQWVETNGQKGHNGVMALINLRNLFKIVVSADDRYGPIFNQGSAGVILEALLHNDYPLASKIPITFIGYSGGAQVSLGAIIYLKKFLKVPIEMISLGGVFSGNVGFLQLDRFDHLVGERDTVEPIGRTIFPERWPIAWLSYWNQARRLGIIKIISLGPTHHNGVMGYMDGERTLADGRTCRQQTVDTVATLISFP